VGATAEIGDDCLLYQCVTLGGTGISAGKRHPTLGNNVMVGSGAKILGPIQIGDNARVAANAVVLRDVPSNSTVVGVPGRVVRVNGEKLDHIHTPDPVALELQELRQRVDQLEAQLLRKEL
jgi:serine O-acetyltransferase